MKEKQEQGLFGGRTSWQATENVLEKSDPALYARKRKDEFEKFGLFGTRGVRSTRKEFGQIDVDVKPEPPKPPDQGKGGGGSGGKGGGGAGGGAAAAAAAAGIDIDTTSEKIKQHKPKTPDQTQKAKTPKPPPKPPGGGAGGATVAATAAAASVTDHVDEVDKIIERVHLKSRSGKSLDPMEQKVSDALKALSDPNARGTRSQKSKDLQDAAFHLAIAESQEAKAKLPPPPTPKPTVAEVPTPEGELRKRTTKPASKKIILPDIDSLDAYRQTRVDRTASDLVKRMDREKPIPELMADAKAKYHQARKRGDRQSMEHYEDRILGLGWAENQLKTKFSNSRRTRKIHKSRWR